ncbi:hypothetical protein HGB13_00185 [bacterium]|nr:hypothetical protein [bacterium]
MAYKSELIVTKGGVSVKNGSTITKVIGQDGKIYGDINATAGSIGTAELADSAVTTDKLDQGTVKTVIVNLTAAQIIGMAAAPVEVIPAVSGKAIILDDVIFDLTGTATQFTSGGVVNLQYKNTATGAGTTLHADIAATVVTGATGRVVTQRIAKDISATAAADIINVGVFISNKTGAFATGTGTARVIARYHTI